MFKLDKISSLVASYAYLVSYNRDWNKKRGERETDEKNGEKKKKKEKAGKIIKNLDQRFDRVEGKRNNLETFGTRLETSPWYENCRESHSRLARLDKLLKKFQRSGLSFSALLKVSSIVRPLLLRTSSRRFLCKGKKQKGIVRKIFAIFSISGIRNVDRWIDDDKDQEFMDEIF